ncbi:tyrosine-protein kinase JAK2-like isoform X5 [Dreissena polymorpha]|uniref:tyrosine-protein kinase JAK2-like isoform X5 n=1 Tax=Dreissena polymorpha TaxID=45954 RepID=UPI002263BDC4|nr:tyrosine-protein kinase JAK2-like isoform X5 [Dreissena polymorpha]
MDSGSGSSFTSMSFQVSVYGPDRECMKIDVNTSDTYEEVCEAVAERLDIPPVMFNCCGLCVLDGEQKRFLWLPPTKNDIHSRNDVYFRIRFLPYEAYIDVLERKYSPCFQYLFYQVKWDFLHECLSYYRDHNKASEARGAGTFLLATSVRIWAKENNQEENCKEFLEQYDLKMFLPKCVLKSFFDRIMVKSPLIEKANELLKDKQLHPAETFKKYFVKDIISKSNKFYSIEEYRCWKLNFEYKEVKENDTSGKPQTPQLQNSEKEEVLLKTEFKGFNSQITFATKIPCRIETVLKVEYDILDLEGIAWYKVTILAQGVQEEVFFQDKLEMYSFLTAVEKCYCLFVDFYGNICHSVRSPTTSDVRSPTTSDVRSPTTSDVRSPTTSDVRSPTTSDVRSQATLKLHRLRVHGPVSKDFLKKKLENYPDCRQRYAIRMSLDKYGSYDVFYLKNQGDKLYGWSTGKVLQTKDGCTFEDSNIAAVTDLKTLFKQYISSLKSIPSDCTRIKPQQFEGCDEIKRYLLDMMQLQNSEAIEDDEQTRRRLEHAPKVYLRNQVVIGDEIEIGYFTEVKRALLNEEQVIVKMLKQLPAIKQNHQELQEALMESVSKLMEWDSAKFFVGFLGICLMPEPSILLSGTIFCSLKQLLLSERTDMPQLKLEHLMQVPVFLVDALIYMEKKKCYHGNINCDKLVVERFDNMVLKLTDPGMVTIRNKLPLDHALNVERLPWLAPERIKHLSHVTVQSEVWAIGTTLWQMFSGARNPSAEIQDRLGKARSTTLSDCEVVQFFQDNKGFSCPKYLKPEPGDPNPVLVMKDKFYQAILPCWTIDSEDRPNPTMLLRTFNEICQSYGSNNHINSSLDYTEVDVEQRVSESSGSKKRDVPDISALTGHVSENHSLLLHSQLVAESPPNEAAGSELAPAVLSQKQSENRVIHWKQTSCDLGTLPEVPRQRHTILPTQLVVDIKKELGKGEYGAVYEAKLRKGSNVIDVVAKFLKSDSPNDKDRAEFEKEASVMELLEHENIVKFYGTCYMDMGFCLVMEYIPKRSLKEYFRSKPDIPKCQIFQFAIDIASGMEYLESMKVLHCDLAARNVLLTSELRAKVCDFGLSKMLEKDYYRLRTEKKIPLYCNGSVPNMNCDDTNEFVRKLVLGERLKKPKACSDVIYNFMNDCWNEDPSKRPTFSQCREKFIQSLMSQKCDHDNHRSFLASCTTNRGWRSEFLANGIGHWTAVEGLHQQTKAAVTAVTPDLSTSDNMTNTNRNSLVLSETSLKIFWDSDSIIGKGAFGDIFVGRFEHRNVHVAVKKC